MALHSESLAAQGMARKLLLLLTVAAVSAGVPSTAPADESVFVGHLKSGQRESLLYVWTTDADAGEDDFIAVIDVRPSSPTYGKIIAAAPAGSSGNDAHHFGYTVDAGRIFAAGLTTNRLFIYDVKAAPHAPRLIRTVDLAALTGYTGPHSVYAVPDGVVVTMLGGKDGGPPGALVKLDHEGALLQILGKAEGQPAAPAYMYDIGVKPERNRMVTSGWAHPRHISTGRIPPEHTGNAVAVWDFKAGRVLQVNALDPGPLAVRWLHSPSARGGYVNCIDGASIWYWEDRDGTFEFSHVLQFPAGAAPGDVRISHDDRFMYVSLWGRNEIHQYDVRNRLRPRLVSSVALPSPLMLNLSPDGRRLYVTNSGMGVFDAPDVNYRVRLVNVGPGGMAVDRRFDVDFDALATGQARPHDMLLR